MPSVSGKQQRFMGAELGRKRAGKKTQTGMSEQQLREFAGSRVSKATHEKDGRSLVDIEFHKRKPESAVLCDAFTHPVHKGYSTPTWGELDPPAIDGDAPQFTPGKQSCNRDAGQGLHYGAPIEFFGPDTDFRVEEVNPHHYGRDYEPSPYKDLFKTGEKAEEVGIRLREEYRYEEEAMPGAVPDKGLDSSMAYGAISYKKVPSELPDNRSFDSQLKYRRQDDDTDDDMPENGPKLKPYKHR